MSRNVYNYTYFTMYLIRYNGISNETSTEGITKIESTKTTDYTKTKYPYSGSSPFVLAIDPAYPKVTIGVKVGNWDEETVQYPVTSDTHTIELYNEDTGDYDDIPVKIVTGITFSSSDTRAVDLISDATASTETEIFVTNNLTNATVTIKPNPPIQGKAVTISVSPKSGYHITSLTLTDNNNKSYSFTKNSVTISDTSAITSLTLGGTVEKNEAITKTINYSLDEHMTGTPASFTEGETVTITLTADDGYYIKSCSGKYYDNSTGDYGDIVFTVSDDKKTATATVTDTTDYSAYSVTGDSDASETPVTVEGGLVSIYLPTDEQLGQIGQKRFQTLSGGSVATYDIGVYIVSYIKMYLNIPVIGKTDAILGNFNTNVEVNVTDSYFVTFDCGTVQVEGVNKNALDYDYTEIELFLPFIGYVNLPAEKVVDKTIHVVYTVNIINGECSVEIFADDVLIDTTNGNAGYTVPYIMNDAMFQHVNNYEFSGAYMLGKTPYIMMYYKNAISNEVNYNTEKWVRIGDMTGYVKFSDVILTGITASENELEEIENLLLDNIIL